ncbi:SDR family NAD(P)-dependent oxidoreductase [Oceanobacillus massiliensis]|uniref:SDR family NAD(P)-dependent oxidoreductase n=1 Tax=Oceanobacillus massiliensis TaxID=1465765 RepID=UPI00301A751E
MARLEDKVALITGSGAGMGRETALLFAKEGATIIVSDINTADGEAVKDEIIQNGGKASFYELNVAKEENVKAVIEDIAATHGKLDILVNNAGVTGVDKQTHELEEKDIDLVFSVDVKGVMFCTKYAVQQMKKQGQGSIVNFSSIYGLVGSDELTAYALAKGAVTTNLTRQDAISYGPDHIRLNSVHPGTILTPLVKELGSRGEGGLDAYKEKMGAKHPIGFLGEPIDVAYAVLSLSSDEARFVTGAHLAVDGGYTAK